MKFMVAWFRALLAGLVLAASMTGLALSAELRMAVTTSFHNSGLADLLLPEIKKDIDLDVRLVVRSELGGQRLGPVSTRRLVELLHCRQQQLQQDGCQLLEEGRHYLDS